MKRNPAHGVCCPKCGSTESDVIDSRPAFDMIRRRRQCCNCSTRYTTYEILLGVNKPAELAKKMKEHLDSMSNLLNEMSKLPN